MLMYLFEKNQTKKRLDRQDITYLILTWLLSNYIIPNGMGNFLICPSGVKPKLPELSRNVPQ